MLEAGKKIPPHISARQQLQSLIATISASGTTRLPPERDLCAALGVAAPCPAGMLGSMATVPLPERFQNVSFTGKVAPEQARLYDDFRIEVPLMSIGARRYFRVSAHLHNHPEDYGFLAEAIRGMATGR